MSLLRALELSALPTRKSPSAASRKTAEAITAAAATKTGNHLRAAESWRQTHGQANERITLLKQAVKAHCADAHPALVKEIDHGLAKLDNLLDTVDHRLADSLAKAGKAADDAARSAELKNAKAILIEYTLYVKNESLVAHIDNNPFHVETGLKALLISGLAVAAKAIG